MRDAISPEEKLLRLIRGSKKRAATAQGDNIPAPASQAVSGKLPWQIWKLLFLGRHILKFNLRQALRWGFALSFLYLVICLIYPWVGLKELKLPLQADMSATYAELANGTQTKPFEFYIDGVGARQVFGGADKGGTALSQAAAGVNVADDINLVGIISGENPQAIVEDKKSQKTYYLSRGQLIGDLKVDDIGDGKIIVERLGQKFELYL